MTMRVLHVIEPAVGGSARNVFMLIGQQAERGYELALAYSPRRMEAYFEQTVGRLRDSGRVSVHAVPMRRAVNPLEDLEALLAIRRLCDDFHPRILHLHSAKAGMLGRIVRPMLGRAAPLVVYQPQGFAFLRRPSRALSFLYRSLESLTSPLVDLCVATSGDERMLAQGGTPPWFGRMTVVPNAVVTPRPDPMAVAELRARLAPQGTILLDYVGGLVAEKRGQDIVAAVAELVAEGRKVRVVIVGDGPERPGLERLAKELGAGDAVVFAGYQKDPAPYQAAADIAVHASGFESFGIAVAESLALGRPVVAGAAPGVRELVRHGESGLLYPVGDARAMAAALRTLLDDEALRKKYGARAAEEIAGRFSPERVATMMHDAYVAALGG